MIPQNLQLENNRAVLRRLQMSDVETLKEVAFAPIIWKWSSSNIYDEVSLTEYVRKGVEERCAFLIFDKATNRVAGCTSYGNIHLKNNRLEIGWTWIGVDFQRTGLNRACKSLLLQYAFEILGCKRVELKTDTRNSKSRTAMEAMGAQPEGILRSHMALSNSSKRRDTIYYSILEEEWKRLKTSIFKDFVG
ncbi:MAG: GNAT family N-acetyltransferase [Chitinophagales bacterium]